MMNKKTIIERIRSLAINKIRPPAIWAFLYKYADELAVKDERIYRFDDAQHWRHDPECNRINTRACTCGLTQYIYALERTEHTPGLMDHKAIGEQVTTSVVTNDSPE